MDSANGNCTNRLRMPADVMHEAVLTAIEEHALTVDAVASVLLAAQHDDTDTIRQRVETALADVDVNMARIVAAIESGVAARSRNRESDIDRAASRVRTDTDRGYSGGGIATGGVAPLVASRHRECTRGAHARTGVAHHLCTDQ
jgi:hypothetical protein